MATEGWLTGVNEDLKRSKEASIVEDWLTGMNEGPDCALSEVGTFED